MSPETRIAQIREEARFLSDRARDEMREPTSDESVRLRELLTEAAVLGDATASKGVLHLSEIEAGALDDRETALLVADAGSWALSAGVDGIADAITALSPVERDAMLGALVLLWQGRLERKGGSDGREFVARSVELFRRRSGDVGS